MSEIPLYPERLKSALQKDALIPSNQSESDIYLTKQISGNRDI
jgi:hypothetical protein